MGKSASKALDTLQLAGHWLVYALFRCFEGVLRLLPMEWVWHLGRCIGLAGYFLLGKYRLLALRNLRLAFGAEHDEAWRRRVARAHFGSLVANILCGFKLPTLEGAEVMRRVKIEGMEPAREAAEAGRPVVYLLCHMSCWELLTQLPRVFEYNKNPATIYQPLRNPFLDALVTRRRRKLGYVLFDRQAGFNGPIKHLRESGCLGVLVDQHAGNQGLWCPFFNRLASTTPVAALMAQRCRGLMMPVGIHDDGPGHWRITGLPPVDTTTAGLSIEGLTCWMNAAVEKLVRRQPHNWFWVHNRWKTPKPRFLLSREKRGVALPEDLTAERLQKFEMLLRSPNWLGDACMALPAAHALKQGRPDLRLTVFGPEKLRGLWEAQPWVDAYIGKQGGEGPLSVARKLRASGVCFDAALLLTNSTRSTLEFRLAGIPRLAGFRGSLRALFLNQIIKEPKISGPPWHHARRYLHLAGRCGASTEGWEKDLPVNQAPAGVNRVGVCAGAEYGPAKRWPLENFAAVIASLGARMPELEWIFFGAPGEAAMGEDLSKKAARARHSNLVGKTSLAGLITELKTCRLLLTNDTGTMHLAAALGVPTVSIFGSTEPVLTGPLGAGHTIIRHHVPCSPCFKRECPFGHYECMTGVTPDRVSAAVEAALHAAPSPAKA
ncbi:MAG TPA: lipopolysaccharide heptosyltransferase II [Prosthecobacter sp.]|nr:lipopolysaccharide heptosyltransferase II [Prosthecobacter sp.]HRK15530.1 lipopolysaccharide heptosyltransferase II [Prosthecobacter sp.]